MKKDLLEVSNLFENLEKNIRFIMDRRNKHADIVTQITNSVRNITVFKVFVVIIMSVIQILLIKRFFGNSKKIGLNPFYDSGLQFK